MAAFDFGGSFLYGLESYLRPTSQKLRLLRELEFFQGFWLAEAIVETIADDVLAPSPSGECVDITYTGDNRKIKGAVEQLQEQVNIDFILSSIIHELLWFGEQYRRIKTDPGRGVVELVEEPELHPATAFTIWSSGSMSPDWVVIGKKAIKPEKLFILSLPPRITYQTPLGYSIKGVTGPKRKQHHRFKSGSSVLRSALSKLKEVYLLEIAIPGSRLLDMLSPKLVGIQVPPGMPMDKLEDMMERYDKMLNRNLKLARSGQIELEDLLSKGMYAKAIPIAGDKGQLSPIDLTDTRRQSLLEELQDARRAACSAASVPPSYVLGEEGATRQDTLKQHIRYARRVRTIQQEVGRAVKQLVKVHLEALGMRCPENQIAVQFKNTINIEELDRVEFEDTLFSTIANTASSLSGLKDVGVQVNSESLKKYLNAKLSGFGLTIEDVPPEEENSEEG